jgi:uncharacterized membrane protein YphA (DoxX/SURF4 family)
MTGWNRTPHWVDEVLSWDFTWVAARIGLVSAYVLGGLTKISDFPAAATEQEHFGLNPGWIWASLAIIVELGGSALVISGYYVWLGAGGLGVLTAIAMFVANDFWAKTGNDRFIAVNDFFEHLGLIAGLVILSVLSQHSQGKKTS